jgi:hydrogenase maturation protease
VVERNDLLKSLIELDPDDTILVGTGNSLKGDDAAGLAVIRGLSGIQRIEIIDAGSAPENYLGKIIASGRRNLIFIDAMVMRKEPGMYGLVNFNEVYDGDLSTHAPSLSFLVDLIRQEREVSAMILGIEPADLSFREGLSEPVRRAVSEIVDKIKEWTGFSE